MSLLTSIPGRFMAALRAFREPVITANFLDMSEFDDFDSRRLRYSILWSFYENTAYRNIHNWAVRYKVDYGLYKYTRNLYNPTNRLVNFYETHLMGGQLDMLAGDGEEIVSALPIVTENELLRPAIGKIWEWSNWQAKKDLYCKLGAAMGDIGLKVIDNPERQKVYIQIIRPEIIKDKVIDDFGNVKSYVLEEERADPFGRNRTVTFTEIAIRGEGNDVHFATLMNGSLFPWNGVESEWTIPYGFVPFIYRPHIDNMQEWGWAESHAARSKIHESDDIASKLDDQIRKTVDSPWLFSGLKKSDNEVKTSGGASSTDNPQPGREEIPAIYAGDPNAKATPLIAPLDISAVTEQIKALNEEMEREYPELSNDLKTTSGDASGRALRLARQNAEAKILQRRVAYDTGLVHAHNMAVAIAGERGYDPVVFAGFNLDSFERGDLAHTIGRRPVFSKDKTDDLENNTMFWGAAKTATEAGMSLAAYLESQGWTKDQIRKATRQNRRANGNRTRRGVAPVTAVDASTLIPDDVENQTAELLEEAEAQ